MSKYTRFMRTACIIRAIPGTEMEIIVFIVKKDMSSN